MWERGRSALVVAILGVLLGASPAWGQESSPGPPWQIELTPYLWLTSFAGDLAVRNSPKVNFDVPFGSVFHDLDFAAMFSLEARRGPWGFLLDSIYAKLSRHGTCRRTAF